MDFIRSSLTGWFADDTMLCVFVIIGYQRDAEFDVTGVFYSFSQFIIRFIQVLINYNIIPYICQSIHPLANIVSAFCTLCNNSTRFLII